MFLGMVWGLVLGMVLKKVLGMVLNFKMISVYRNWSLERRSNMADYHVLYYTLVFIFNCILSHYKFNRRLSWIP